MNKNFELKDYIGIFFFIGAIVLLILMIFNPVNQFLIHIDEYFTLGLVQLPFLNGMELTIADVHPPLYYLILEFIIGTLNTLHIPFNIIYLSKIVSTIPYLLILVLSGTKIRKEYGWLTAGIFVFAVGIMSDFFRYYIIARMYSWSLLFLLISFIALKGVIERNDTKSWIILTVFTIFGAYTHYYGIISGFMIYVLLLLYILIQKEETVSISFKNIISNLKGSSFKKWIISLIAIIIAYIPWISTVVSQATNIISNSSSWIKPPTLKSFLKLFIYPITPSKIFIIKILAVITLIIILALLISKLRDKQVKENTYILFGFSIFLGTIIIGTLISIFVEPFIFPRYLIPITGIFWYTFAILIGKQNNKKILIFLVTFILILGLCGAYVNQHNLSNYYKQEQNDQNIFNIMNTNDSIVIYTSGVSVLEFEDYLNKTDGYTLSSSFKNCKLENIKSKTVTKDQLIKIVNKNKSKKKIYIIQDEHKDELDLGPKYKIGQIWNRRMKVYILK